MLWPNRILGTGCCFFILSALIACAAPTANLPTQPYHPVIQTGKTYGDAANVLLNTLREGNPVWLDINNTSVPIKCAISNNKMELLKQYDGQPVSAFCFYSLLDLQIVLEGSGLIFIPLPGSTKLRFSSAMREDAKKSADALYFIQQEIKNYRDRLDKQLVEFEPMAARYRALESKPKMSEEQRKLIVQANALTEQKQYFHAREKYREAIELDRTAYPGAYYNLALLEAQMNLPFAAISYMKHYLLLAPEAKDARGAQDKLYEWELLMPPPFAKEITTNVRTEPVDAFVEINVSNSGKRWTFLGRAPGKARFWRSDPRFKFCLIRASKPGYVTQEKSFEFDTLPAQVNILLEKSDSGEDSHGYLGIRYELVTEESAKSSGLQTLKGLMVKEVLKDSPAGKAGLKPGDILLTFGGKETNEMIDLPRMASTSPSGATVEVKIFRQGQERTVNVTIGQLPD